MPTQTGIYTIDDAQQGHLHSQVLAEKMKEIFNNDKLVIDFGCGKGLYLQYLQNFNYEVLGIDGINADNLSFVEEIDLSKEVNLDKRGNVISLEVGEHIPENYESNFINNLVSHCDNNLLLSWAVIGQQGIGHINCKNNDYIISKITDQGFTYNHDTTVWLRDGIEDYCSYFRNTLMFFSIK